MGQEIPFVTLRFTKNSAEGVPFYYNPIELQWKEQPSKKAKGEKAFEWLKGAIKNLAGIERAIAEDVYRFLTIKHFFIGDNEKLNDERKRELLEYAGLQDEKPEALRFGDYKGNETSSLGAVVFLLMRFTNPYDQKFQILSGLLQTFLDNRVFEEPHRIAKRNWETYLQLEDNYRGTQIRLRRENELAFATAEETPSGSVDAIEQTASTEMPKQISFEEGKRQWRLQEVIQRSQALVRNAKEYWLSQNEDLPCHVCGMSFRRTYGELGAKFIEAHHHIVPIRNLEGVTETNIEALAMVCSNCHSMLERDSSLTIAQLAEIVSEQKRLHGFP